MRLEERTIHFWTAIGHAVDHVFSGNTHNEFGAGGDRIDVRANDAGLVIVDRSHRRADRAADATLADKPESVFRSDTIHGSKIHAVFHRA